MAEKDKKPTAGFDVLADFIVGNKSGINPVADDLGTDSNYQDIDPDDLQKQLGGDDDKKPDLPDDKPTDKKVDEPVKKDDKKTDIKTESDDMDDKSDKSDEDKEYESEISSFFAGELAKKLGLDIDDKDLKVESVDEVIELMNEIVAESSKPTYASKEVEEYDEFVRNGGDLRTFYKEMYEGKLNLESLDLEKEYDQRAIIRENLLNQGYKEERIKRMITRYEEAETLKEEAEDALDLLKDFNQKKQESLLAEQKKVAENVRKQQQKFYDDVNATIKTVSNFRGFPISEKEKRELLQYAFVPDEDGLTKYQKEFRGDVLNILESAYFTKNKDKIKAGDVNKKGDSDAYKTLRDKLKARSNKTVDNDNSKGGKLSGGSLGDFGKGIIF